MKHYIVIPSIAALALVLSGTGSSFADSSNASPNVGGGMPSSEKVPQDKHTDLTKGQEKIPEEYSTTPVRQGSLKEVTDSKWLNQPVTNKQGEKLGTIKKVLKDEKTQKIEYVIFEVADSRHARPMPFSRFEERGDKIVLNATKEELLPSASRQDAKDLSPDLAMYMDEIERVREEPKGAGGGHERGSSEPGSLSGATTHGEEKVGSHPAAPATPAPGFEQEGAKKK